MQSYREGRSIAKVHPRSARSCPSFTALLSAQTEMWSGTGPPLDVTTLRLVGPREPPEPQRRR